MFHHNVVYCSFILILLLFPPKIDCTCKTSCNVCKKGRLTILCLKNKSYYQMGFDYGENLKEELKNTLSVLIKHFDHLNISYQNLVDEAEKFHHRYISTSYRNFLFGLVDGAGLTLNDGKILNGMETLQSLSFACAFAFLSRTNFSMILRNYDYPTPFNIIASQNLIVTIIDDYANIPTAIIGMPGQIYCPTCLNAANIFVELNNGQPSGGSGVTQNRPTMLLNLLEIIQQSDSLKVMEKKLNSVQSDYSLIINIADSKRTTSFEYSNVNGVKPFTSSNKDVFVSTNFFLNTSWNLPPPLDQDTWMGVTRRNNLETLLSRNECDLNCVKYVMDVKLKDGGALWEMTIYQIVYDTGARQLYIRMPKNSLEWIQIDLAKYFSTYIINASSLTVDNSTSLLFFYLCSIMILVTLGNFIILKGVNQINSV